MLPGDRELPCACKGLDPATAEPFKRNSRFFAGDDPRLGRAPLARFDRGEPGRGGCCPAVSAETAEKFGKEGKVFNTGEVLTPAAAATNARIN